MSVTIFGDWADAFDARVEQAIRDLDWWVMSAGGDDPRSLIEQRQVMAVAATAQAFMRFAQGSVDVLRLGEGASEGTASGIGEDALRLLVVAGPVIRFAGRGIRLLRASRATAISQAPGALDCSWVAVSQAVRRTGHAYFIKLQTLFQRAGIGAAEMTQITGATGTSPSQFAQLLNGLRQLRIPFANVNAHSIQHLLSIVGSRATSVFVFTIEYTTAAGQRVGHTLHAAVVEGSVQILDTSGAVFRTVHELRAGGYTSATLWGTFPIVEIPHAVVIAETAGAAMTGAGGTNVASNAVSIGLHVILPAQVRGLQGYGYTADGRRVGDWPDEVPQSVSGRRGLPGYGCLANGQPTGSWPVGVPPTCDGE